MQPDNQARAIFALTGPNVQTDQIVVTEAGLTAGRVAEDNDLDLFDQKVSRNHLRFDLRDGVVYVTDLGSRNGTWLGDTRLTANVEQALDIGDGVRVGPYTLILREVITPQAAELPVPPPPELPPEPDPPEESQADDEFVLMPPLRRSIKEPPNGHVPNGLFAEDGYPIGFPKPPDGSNWLQYLPAIYSEDDFTGRYLLIAETIMTPITWIIDNFDLYLSPEVTPTEWLRWIASWFDLLLVPELPLERQRAVMDQIGWLFFRRGTRAGLERLLELYFGLKPEIHEDQLCHFTVRLHLSRLDWKIETSVIERLIASQKPAFVDYTLDIT